VYWNVVGLTFGELHRFKKWSKEVKPKKVNNEILL
jgi:hypothetical protein